MTWKLGTVVVLSGALLASLTTQARADLKPWQSSKANQTNSGVVQTTGTGVDGPFHFASELDEQIGDTVNVMHNWRDQQHNCNFGRMIGVDNSNPDDEVIHFTFTEHQSETGPRNVTYVRMHIDGEGNTTIDEPSVVGSQGGGYTVLSLDPETGAPFLALHDPATGGGYDSAIMSESQFVEGFFDEYDAPHPNGVSVIWPQLKTTRSGGSLYGHLISNGNEAPHDTEVYYHRALWDPNTASWTNATPNEADMLLVTPYSMDLSTIVTANNDGSMVTIASTVSRWMQGEGPDSWDGSRMSQSDNDIYVWTSNDGGDSWDFENPVNVTNFIGPDEALLPDTTAANGDTLRAYAEVDAIYDADNTLHLAFNTLLIDYWRTQGESSYTGRLWYWNDEDQLFVQIADGTFFNGTATQQAAPAAWELMVCHANLYKDPVTGYLWASWVQYGNPDEILEGDIPMDGSASGYANSDIYVSASPDNGLHWAKGVNVTNTRSTQGQLSPGESRSERDPSMAYNSDGDYLNLFYTLDYDAGISPVAGQEEGVATNNQMVYQRVPKQALIDQFNENAEWVRNYPMHVDSTDMYVDPNDWAWFDFDPTSVNTDGQTLQPNQFELQQNYPNPFNPSTRIAFTLKSAGHVKLAVYDVLGREVATLVNRGMAAGQHAVTFLGNDLPSGVYFYKLSSGDVSQVRKMVLMK